MNPDETQRRLKSTDRLVIVSSEITATVSNRVGFHSQDIRFLHFANDDIDLSGLVNSNRADSSKGIHFLFPKSIKTGSYTPTAPDYPFETLCYFENGANAGNSRSFTYNAASGIVDVEVKSNTDDLLSYVIDFDVTGENPSTGSLGIKGKATFIILMVAPTAK